jgi:ABC-type molybdate transport system permease subunit
MDSRDGGLLSLNLRYYALRAALFGGFLAVWLLLGLGELLSVALAVVASGLVSFPLAMRQRRASVAAIEARRGVRP